MKSSTDRFWDERAQTVADDSEVNIADVHQRGLELDFVLPRLEPHMRVLEVGCGNGFATSIIRDRVKHVDAFDYSPAMIDRARRGVGETNNRFFHDNLLAPEHVGTGYDCAICIRVLINLRDLDEQRRALANLTERLAPNGLLLLVEGFQGGFERLNDLRDDVGLARFDPAPINFYSRVDEVLNFLHDHYDVEAEFNTGAMDLLTRVVLPAIVGPENVSGVTPHHEALAAIARQLPVEPFEEFGRVRGWALRRKS